MKAKLFITLILLSGVAAHATSIVYTVSTTATGTLGKSSFSNQLLTVIFSSDTSTLTVLPGAPWYYHNTVGTGTLDIGGTLVATFTDALQFFDNQNAPAAGISDLTNGVSVLDTFSPVFSTYTGATAIGPITGPSFFLDNFSYGTTAGALQLSTAGELSIFTATTTSSAIPEPGTLTLLVTGLLGTAATRRRFIPERSRVL